MVGTGIGRKANLEEAIRLYVVGYAVSEIERLTNISRAVLYGEVMNRGIALRHHRAR